MIWLRNFIVMLACMDVAAGCYVNGPINGFGIPKAIWCVLFFVPLAVGAWVMMDGKRRNDA